MSNPIPSASTATHCPRCGADNRCALVRGDAPESCWCHREPVALPLPASIEAACYCADCLRTLLQEANDAR